MCPVCLFADLHVLNVFPDFVLMPGVCVIWALWSSILSVVSGVGWGFFLTTIPLFRTFRIPPWKGFPVSLWDRVPCVRVL